MYYHKKKFAVPSIVRAPFFEKFETTAFEIRKETKLSKQKNLNWQGTYF